MNNFEKIKKEYGKRKFPLLVQEGWIRPQFSLMALSTGGDGVVKIEFRMVIQPPPPNPCEYGFFQDIRLVIMDLGTPPEPGGEIFNH